jgi:hypothetical protein
VEPQDHHVALPKLYGAPAYARPPRAIEVEDRPPDPDDLPLEAYRSDDDPDGGDGAWPDALGVSSAGTSVVAASSDDARVQAASIPSAPSALDDGSDLEARPFSVGRLRRFLERD